MPLTLVTTVGSASANSYCTKAEADTFSQGIFPRSAVDAWEISVEDDQLRALVAAARRLDEERFVGDRVDSSQALAWPRSAARKPSLLEFYETDEIPPAVKQAQARLAFFLLDQVENQANADPLAASNRAGIASVSIPDGPSLSFEAGATSVSALDRFLTRILRPLLNGLVYAPSARAVRG